MKSNTFKCTMIFADNFDANMKTIAYLQYVLHYNMCSRHTHTEVSTKIVFRKSYFHHCVNCICHFILKSRLLNDFGTLLFNFTAKNNLAKVQKLYLSLYQTIPIHHLIKY